MPSGGTVNLDGTQHIWVGKPFAGRTVTIWIDAATIHVLLDDAVIKTVPSRLTTAGRERLAMRGARPGRSSPALPALDKNDLAAARVPVEIDRTVNRDGVVSLLGHELTLGPHHSRTRVTLRIDGGLIHAIAGGHLIKTLPNPLAATDLPRIKEPRRAETPLPPTPAAGPEQVQRRVPKDGVIMVARKRLRVGSTNAGTVVAVVVDDHHFRVLHGKSELSLHARTTTIPIRDFNATKSRKR